MDGNQVASVVACAEPERGDLCGQRMARHGLCYRNGSPRAASWQVAPNLA